MTPLLLQAATTLPLTGLIWTIQLLHYPLMDGVGGEAFARYHARHTRRMTWLVALLMPAELLASVWIVFALPARITPALAWTGLVLVLLVWAATAALSIPAHARLAQGFDARAHRRLVQTNWIRTVAWSLRAVIALWMLAIQAARPLEG